VPTDRGGPSRVPGSSPRGKLEVNQPALGRTPGAGIVITIDAPAAGSCNERDDDTFGGSPGDPLFALNLKPQPNQGWFATGWSVPGRRLAGTGGQPSAGRFPS